MIFDQIVIGQKVWDIDGSKGIIHRMIYEEDSPYPITVKFGDDYHTYTKDGKYFTHDNSKSLFLNKEYIPRKVPKVKKEWSPTYPTKDGWYWTREINDHDNISIVNMDSGNEWPNIQTRDPREWLGPIKVPK